MADKYERGRLTGERARDLIANRSLVVLRRVSKTQENFVIDNEMPTTDRKGEYAIASMEAIQKKVGSYDRNLLMVYPALPEDESLNVMIQNLHTHVKTGIVEEEVVDCNPTSSDKVIQSIANGNADYHQTFKVDTKVNMTHFDLAKLKMRFKIDGTATGNIEVKIHEVSGGTVGTYTGLKAVFNSIDINANSDLLSTTPDTDFEWTEGDFETDLGYSPELTAGSTYTLVINNNSGQAILVSLDSTNDYYYGSAYNVAAIMGSGLYDFSMRVYWSQGDPFIVRTVSEFPFEVEFGGDVSVSSMIDGRQPSQRLRTTAISSIGTSFVPDLYHGALPPANERDADIQVAQTSLATRHDERASYSFPVTKSATGYAGCWEHDAGATTLIDMSDDDVLGFWMYIPDEDVFPSQYDANTLGRAMMLELFSDSSHYSQWDFYMDNLSEGWNFITVGLNNAPNAIGANGVELNKVRYISLKIYESSTLVTATGYTMAYLESILLMQVGNRVNTEIPEINVSSTVGDVTVEGMAFVEEGKEYMNGTGAKTAFYLTNVPSQPLLEVAIYQNGVWNIIEEGVGVSQYSVSGRVVTFGASTIPPTGTDNVRVKYMMKFARLAEIQKIESSDLGAIAAGAEVVLDLTGWKDLGMITSVAVVMDVETNVRVKFYSKDTKQGTTVPTNKYICHQDLEDPILDSGEYCNSSECRLPLVDDDGTQELHLVIANVGVVNNIASIILKLTGE
ncbi:hypothetical protein [Sulfuricurvum sp.]|uniref:hypothetical protein n=1 Tax=Sulfuricurvum sp. TaxID=2025608 RepID=UPI0035663994